MFFLIRALQLAVVLVMVARVCHDIVSNRHGAFGDVNRFAMDRIEALAKRATNVVGDRGVTVLLQRVSAFDKSPSVPHRNELLNLISAWMHLESDAPMRTYELLSRLLELADTWTEWRLGSAHHAPRAISAVAQPNFSSDIFV